MTQFATFQRFSRFIRSIIRYLDAPPARPAFDTYGFHDDRSRMGPPFAERLFLD